MQHDVTISSIRVGIYTRLSHDDGDLNIKESESITNQKDFLINYVLEHNWCLAKIYADDGYSGTNFERPGFSQMLQDIENNIINVVITKDFSRLGRNYSMTRYYIDEYFPEHNIRYIAVNDNVDTFQNEDNSISAFMCVVNDLYAKDTSKKIRTTFRLKQQKGEYLGTSPPFIQ